MSAARSASSVERARLSACSTGAHHVPASKTIDVSQRRLGGTFESTVVEGVADERADRGVHAPGVVEEDALIVGHGPVFGTNDVRQRRHRSPVGVSALDRLIELLRIAEQHQVLRRSRRRDRVGQAELPGLVDDQHIKLLAQLGPREEPRGAADDVVVAVEKTLRCLRGL